MVVDVLGILWAPAYLEISRRHWHNGWFNSHLTLQSPHTPDANKRHCAFGLKSTEIICFWRRRYEDEEPRGNNIKENGQSTPPRPFYWLLWEIQWWKTKTGHTVWWEMNPCGCDKDWSRGLTSVYPIIVQREPPPGQKISISFMPEITPSTH